MHFCNVFFHTVRNFQSNEKPIIFLEQFYILQFVFVNVNRITALYNTYVVEKLRHFLFVKIFDFMFKLPALNFQSRI